MSDGRKLVVGDIHGCARTFQALLARVELERSDTLFLLGDYIDRGGDSRGVIETILRLQEDGFEVRPIRGNHEEMLLLSAASADPGDLMDWLELGGYATLKSYRVSHPRELPPRHLEFIEALPLYRTTERFVMVHAGLDLSLADPFSSPGRSAMLWDRSTRGGAAKLGGKRIVAGHTPVPLEEMRLSLRGEKIMLDNGCVFGSRHPGMGNLVAFDLDTEELVLQPNIDRV